MDWVQLKPSVTLSNVTPPNNLLYNSYFENFTILPKTFSPLPFS